MADTELVQPPQITVKFFQPHEEELFRGCLKGMPNEPEGAIVQPLGRVGFSGAKVFMFFPDLEPSLPYVGKIHTPLGISREVQGLNNAFSQFLEARQQKFQYEGPSSSIIAIPLVSSVGPAEEPSVTELADMLFSRRAPPDTGEFRYSDEEIIAKIDAVYEANCGTSMKKVRPTSVILGEEYKWYLRKCMTDGRLRTWLGARSSDESIDIDGGSYPNPLTYATALRGAKRELPCCTVHGDLHPSNVVLDGNSTPRLLDFTWCQKNKHVLKDFLVMECSIRFLMMPNHLGQVEQMELDGFFLDPSPEAGAELLTRLRANGVDPPTLSSVERCMKIVGCLRGHARRVCGDAFRIEDYWACQALVLYGLMRIDRYPFGRCARALSQLCMRLRERSYLG